MLLASLSDGRAWEKFRQWIAAQGGDLGFVDHTSRLPRARLIETLPSSQAGYIAGLDAMRVGLAAAHLGGGRRRKGDSIDHAVGVSIQAKVGDRVGMGAPLCTIHANSEERLVEARSMVKAAYRFSQDAVPLLPLVHQIIK
jgi:pyrimidine-nucleoside phosphorylase